MLGPKADPPFPSRDGVVVPGPIVAYLGTGLLSCPGSHRYLGTAILADGPNASAHPRAKAKAKAKGKGKKKDAPQTLRPGSLPGNEKPNDPNAQPAPKPTRTKDPELEALEMRRRVVVLAGRWREKLEALDSEVAISLEQAQAFPECHEILVCTHSKA